MGVVRPIVGGRSAREPNVKFTNSSTDLDQSELTIGLKMPLFRSTNCSWFIYIFSKYLAKFRNCRLSLILFHSCILLGCLTISSSFSLKKKNPKKHQITEEKHPLTPTWFVSDTFPQSNGFSRSRPNQDPRSDSSF